MEGQGAGWISSSEALLMAAASRGWVALIGLLAITITANAAAYFLVLAIRNWNKPDGISIRTPFLPITSGAPRNSKELNDSANDKVEITSSTLCSIERHRSLCPECRSRLQKRIFSVQSLD